MNHKVTLEMESDFYQDNSFQEKRKIVITKEDGRIFVKNGNGTKKEATLMFNGWEIKLKTEEGAFLVFDNHNPPYSTRKMFLLLS